MGTKMYIFLALHNVSFNVKSHGDGIELDECQSGGLLPCIEKPYRKKRMTGRMFTEEKCI